MQSENNVTVSNYFNIGAIWTFTITIILNIIN